MSRTKRAEVRGRVEGRTWWSLGVVLGLMACQGEDLQLGRTLVVTLGDFGERVWSGRVGPDGRLVGDYVMAPGVFSAETDAEGTYLLRRGWEDFLVAPLPDPTAWTATAADSGSYRVITKHGIVVGSRPPVDFLEQHVLAGEGPALVRTDPIELGGLGGFGAFATGPIYPLNNDENLLVTEYSGFSHGFRLRVLTYEDGAFVVTATKTFAARNIETILTGIGSSGGHRALAPAGDNAYWVVEYPVDGELSRRVLMLDDAPNYSSVSPDGRFAAIGVGDPLGGPTMRGITFLVVDLDTLQTTFSTRFDERHWAQLVQLSRTETGYVLLAANGGTATCIGRELEICPHLVAQDLDADGRGVGTHYPVILPDPPGGASGLELSEVVHDISPR